MNDTAVSPQTTFDWLTYADATFAGLSVLIPVPLVDLAFETWFKRRMVRSIARRNQQNLPDVVVQIVNQGEFGCWPGCIVWPIKLLFEFLKRLYRTILYFLTIKAATDQLSYYWHRAFLLDYMMRRGDLDDVNTAVLAAKALKLVLSDITTSPLIQLAQQITQGVSHIGRTVWGWARRRQEDEVISETRSEMARSWGRFDEYFMDIARRYEAQFDMLKNDASPSTSSGGTSV